MSELTLTAVRLGLLVALWLFVVSVVAVIRTDIYGTQIKPRASRRGKAPRRTTPAAAPTGASVPAEPAGTGFGRNTPRSIVVTEGSLTGASINLTGAPILVGRNPEATLVLDDDYASGRHARIFTDENRWYVEDLGSTNGTYVGRERISAPTALAVGSTLRIGQTTLELRK